VFSSHLVEYIFAGFGPAVTVPCPGGYLLFSRHDNYPQILINSCNNGLFLERFVLAKGSGFT
jgi:hypothetical protein